MDKFSEFVLEGSYTFLITRAIASGEEFSKIIKDYDQFTGRPGSLRSKRSCASRMKPERAKELLRPFCFRPIFRMARMRKSSYGNACYAS